MQQIVCSLQQTIMVRQPILQVRRMLQTSPCHRVYEVVEARDTPTSGTALTTRVRKLDFPPFVKDLFVGKFNKSILSYAEVLNYDRHRALEEKVGEISTYLNSRAESLAQVDSKGELPPEVIHWCKKEGMFGLSVPRELGGKDYLATEVARMFEEMGRDISLSEFLAVNEFLGYRAILEHGTQEQKDKYLPPLCAGDWLASFCLQEENAGSDPNSVQATATYDVDNDCYLLEGKKTWVANAASAQLFTVFAQTKVKNYMSEEEVQLTAFLVDLSGGGVTVCDPYPVTSYTGLQFSDVIFNCKVPTTCVLGEPGQGLQVLQSVLHHNKFMMAAGVVTSLKALLNQTVEHCNTRKQFGLHLAKFSLVKAQLARMAGKLYCLESMLYMTAGLVDMSEYPDVEVESVIVKQYAAETSDFIVKTCLSLLGSQAALENSQYQKYLTQNQFLQGWQGSANILKCFIGISGVMHLVQASGPELMRYTQPGLHPITVSKWAHHTRQHRKDQAPLTHKLSDCVHPRMVTTAERLEWVVEKIPFLATKMALRSGENFQIPESELVKLADLVMETYAMTCALSRSSRSYIVGNLHAEHEINLVIPYICDARLRCKQLVLELQNWEGEDEDRNDEYWTQNGFFLAEKGEYCVSHPLSRRTVF
eukprot:GFUD01017589.1.p1 GENE.GFUD01017589.1~~GFUD01017589.1.p1  ORF type:complete len:649 (-),score=211.71 GFUD01017589.1:158-2104(-)